MAKFYCPQKLVFPELTVITYPCEGIEPFLPRTRPGAIEEHTTALYQHNNLFNENNGFNIDLLWENDGELMTDVWLFSQLESWGSGALSEARTYRGLERVHDMGTSAEFGHSVLGREAEYRLFSGINGKPLTMAEYLKTRPLMHPSTTNQQRYFVGR
jgi:hypothetical protein